MSIDLIIMGVSAVGGFISQMYANSQEDQHNQFMEAVGAAENARKDKSGMWIRVLTSITLLTLLSFVMIAPTILDTHVTMVESGWFWNTITETDGILYDDTFRQMLMAMTFFYLGRAPAAR